MRFKPAAIKPTDKELRNKDAERELRSSLSTGGFTPPPRLSRLASRAALWLRWLATAAPSFCDTCPSCYRRRRQSDSSRASYCHGCGWCYLSPDDVLGKRMQQERARLTQMTTQFISAADVYHGTPKRIDETTSSRPLPPKAPAGTRQATKTSSIDYAKTITVRRDEIELKLRGIHAEILRTSGQIGG